MAIGVTMLQVEPTVKNAPASKSSMLNSNLIDDNKT